jgi:hypothetical protein
MRLQKAKTDKKSACFCQRQRILNKLLTFFIIQVLNRGKMKLNMSKNNHTMGRALSLVLTELLPSS